MPIRLLEEHSNATFVLQPFDAILPVRLWYKYFCSDVDLNLVSKPNSNLNIGAFLNTYPCKEDGWGPFWYTRFYKGKLCHALKLT